MVETSATAATPGAPRTSGAPAPPPVRWREVFSGRRGRLTAGLLLLEALAAIHALVVATILPDVRRDLGMVQLYGLVFTATSLATIATIPVAGRAVDRFGARRTLPPILVLFAAGLAVCALSPAMPVLLLGQFLTGAGGGGLYAMSVGTVAKIYPDHMRAKVLALMASMWILPGLVGPSLGALLAETLGWRFAFLAPYPLIALAWVLIAPALELVPAADATAGRLAVRWPLQLMFGAGLVFTSLTIVEWWALAMLAAGLAIGVPALSRIVPPGTLRLSPGVPAAAATAFLLSLGFLAVDAFVTLMLRDVRGLSTGGAGLAVTLATLTWAGGSAWQSGRTERRTLAWLLRVGAASTLAGVLAVAAVLIHAVPVWVAYAGWIVVGFGMGVAFPTIPLAAMRASKEGEESTDVSSVLLLDMLGVAAGAGLGGGVIALTGEFDIDLATGIGGAYAIGAAALALLIVVAGRISPRPDGG
jgi:predicted MFS family arabinose efflux permease